MQDLIERMIEKLRQHKHASDNASKNQLMLWNGDKPEKQPLLLKCALDTEEEKTLPVFNSKEIHYNSEKMLMNGLREAITVINGGREAVPSVRANMGAGIFPSILGVKPLLFEDKMPWVKEYLTKEQLSSIGPEDIEIGNEFKTGLEHMAYMAEMLVGTGCMVYPMDLQGPFDTAHIVYGDNIFYDLYDDPQFIHHLLELCCQAIIVGMEECFKVIPDSGNRVAHYNSLVLPRIKGGLKISEDTSTLLSKAHIEEFVAPYTHKVLEHFGGGYIHYCGKNPHLFEMVMDEPFAYCLNFGNPEKHDMEYAIRRCAEKDKIYYGGIKKFENETLQEYFRKYLRASEKDGRSLLIMDYSCSQDERNSIIEAWESAQIF
jgi:Uroporphyrinogen-III decarboxylase